MRADRILSLTSLAILGVFLFAGCSRTPTISLGQETLENLVKSQSDGRISVTKFSKTNGIVKEVAGQRVYTMEYSATLRFTKGAWKGGDGFTGYFSSFATADRAPGGWEGFGKNWKFFEKNAEIQLTGVIEFEHTEKGWRPTGSNVKTVAILSNRPDPEFYDQFIGLWVDERSWPMKIVKENGQYKLLNNYNDTKTLLDPENQALKFQELGMPVYLHIDPEKRQIHSSGVTYSRRDDEAAYAQLRAAVIQPAADHVTQDKPQEDRGDGDVFKVRAVIDDPDGYTNVRSGKTASSQALAIVRSGEEFSTFQQAGDWWQVKTARGVVGYMHASRIKVRP